MTDIQAISPAQWLIIVNPNAGSKKGEKEWPKIYKYIQQRGFDFTCVFTAHRDHATQLTIENIEAGYRNIVVVGGDGTLNEVLNGIFLQQKVTPIDISLGMIPVGTGNDWCRMFDIPFDYKKAVDILKHKRPFVQDVGKISYFKKDKPQTRYFMNVAGMGYDALVAKKTNLLKEQGKGTPLAYLYFVFASLFQYKFMEGVIEIDDRTVFKGEIFSMNVGICKFNGGGMKQVPNAIPDDGLMDVTLIKKTSKLKVFRYARKLFDGTLVDLPIVNTYRGKSIRMRSTGKIYLEADGESLGHTPFVYEVIPRCLKVIIGP
ncbi:MAG: diacylglycerol kinase family lipid kinase [Bacteroidales bacterium]|jgi:YegS/Rv2252/BmrU family lipid kinase|nr:diacylglycerol kinase family lipid kinase [Bacteroidales bacterium]